MIFQNQQVADEVRTIAWMQLKEFIVGIAEDIFEADDTATLDGVRAHVESKMSNSFPGMASVLLRKSGMIFSKYNYKNDPDYPIILYFDNDKDINIPPAMRRCNGTMVGGLLEDGSIHT